MSSPSDFRPLEFRLAPEYRRCAIYVAIGYVLVEAIIVGLKCVELNDRSWTGMVIGFAFFGSAVLFLVALTFRYRLRIDDLGVWRRRFVHWDLWPWEAFELGNVRYGKLGDQITFPERRWYWRTISASFLGEAQRPAFDAVVSRYVITPPPPDPPATLSLRYGLAVRIELPADGIRYAARPNDEAPLIPWRDVTCAEVIRSSRGRPDFLRLILCLPAPPGHVRVRRQGLRAEGADVNVIVPFLERHLGLRFQITALRGPPADEAEADRRLALLAESERELRTLGRVGRYVLAVLGLLYWIDLMQPWNRPNPVNWARADWLAAVWGMVGVAVVLGGYGAMFWGVVHYCRRDLRREREAVERWRDAQVGAAVPQFQPIPN